jgi:hypothetical protein
LVSFRGFFAIICFGGNFLHFEDKKNWNFFFPIVQIEKKLLKILEKFTKLLKPKK